MGRGISGLLHRCRERVYLCLAELGESGFEQSGDLLRGFQRLMNWESTAQGMKNNRQLILYLFASLFLISGAAGLIYEIVWERLLELYFGVTMVSVTLIVSAYMAGLGVGSLIGGRIARDLKNTL